MSFYQDLRVMMTVNLKLKNKTTLILLSELSRQYSQRGNRKDFRLDTLTNLLMAFSVRDPPYSYM